MLFDNLKDYAVRALVNDIDHLGMDTSCQTYNENEGIRQQQLLAIIPRHHIHYTLRNSSNKKVHFSPHIQADPRKSVSKRSSLSFRWMVYCGVGNKAVNTLSWHMASETKTTLKGSICCIISVQDSKINGKASGVFSSLGQEDEI
ncbi:hypothetical protein OROHE_014936 [Orobanche hederae]